MNAKKHKLFETILLVALFIVGFALGAFFGHGKINNNKVSEKESVSLVFMDSRVGEMKAKAALAAASIVNIPELRPFSAPMNSLVLQTSKSLVYTKTTIGVIEKLLDGGSVRNYGNHYNRSLLSYMMLDMNSGVIKDFISAADSFLKKKSVSDYTDLAFVRDLWVDYLLVEALMKGDLKLVSYWAGCGYLLDDEDTRAFAATLSEDVKEVLQETYSLNSAILALNGRSLKDGRLDVPVALFSSRKSLFIRDADEVEIPIIDMAKINENDSLYIDNDYLYSIAIIASNN